MTSFRYAGALQFSAAEVAAILAVLVAFAVAVTAPGWAAVGYAFHRRRRARGAGRVWPATLGGCVTGLALCAAAAVVVSELLGALGLRGGAGVVLPVGAAWLVCWLVAWLTVRRLPPRRTPPSPPAPPTWPAAPGSPASPALVDPPPHGR